MYDIIIFFFNDTATTEIYTLSLHDAPSDLKKNCFTRKKLSMEEIKQEVKVLERMGHKRLALEAGEDPVNCPIDYIIDAIGAIYDTQEENGNIRRVNVNIAATTVENYKKLKDAKIGTYILFQETYHKPTYDKMHPN